MHSQGEAGESLKNTTPAPLPGPWINQSGLQAKQLWDGEEMQTAQELTPQAAPLGLCEDENVYLLFALKE